VKATKLFQFHCNQFYEAVSISDYIASNGRMTVEHCIGKEFEGSHHDLIEELPQHLTIWIEETQENPNSA
jgi:hypothetical protein